MSYFRKKALELYAKRLHNLEKLHQLAITPTNQYFTKDLKTAYHAGETYYVLQDHQELFLEIFSW